MKNLLKECRTAIIASFDFIFKELRDLIIGAIVFIVLYPLGMMALASLVNKAENISFSYLKAVGLMLGFFLGIVLLGLTIAVVVQISMKLSSSIRDKNTQKTIIEKFNLISNSFQEIDVKFEDDEDTRNFFMGIIETIIESGDGEENYCCLKFCGKINNKIFEILINKNILPVHCLLDILDKLEYRYYLYLEDNKKMFFYIKTENNEALYEEEITNYDLILRCFIPKD